MSEVVRLTLLSHGMTGAMSARRFPADEALNVLGVQQVGAVCDVGRADRVQAGPEKRTRQTAELLGWQPEPDARLADLNCGRWRGEAPGSIATAELTQWLTDPDSAPHGGESIVELFERVRDWLDTVSRTPSRLLAVTHPAVIRAAMLVALDAPPKSFWRIDIPPASRTILHHRGRTWTLRSGIDHP
ncbi:MAG: histidine phosphatase family protein [Mycobacterium sp.]